LISVQTSLLLSSQARRSRQFLKVLIPRKFHQAEIEARIVREAQGMQGDLDESAITGFIITDNGIGFNEALSKPLILSTNKRLVAKGSDVSSGSRRLRAS
jgi:hypothetical protein